MTLFSQPIRKKAGVVYSSHTSSIFRMGIEHEPQTDAVPTLEALRQTEENLKHALEEAMKPVEEGGATESVQDDLRGRYCVAKQAREESENAD